MPRPSSPLTLAAAALGALALTGCGAANPRMLSDNQSQQLTATVNSIEQAVSEGDCDAALTRVVKLQAEVKLLPPNIAGKLRKRLEQGANHLQSRIPQDCRGEEEATPLPTEAPTEAPTETPTATPTPSPTPTPAETEAPEPEAPEETEEGEGSEGEEAEREGAAAGGGNGKGNGNGNGNGKGKGKG